MVRRGNELFVSWNGATEVAAWQVDDAAPVARTGFETRLPRGTRVRALDAAGNVLGEA